MDIASLSSLFPTSEQLRNTVEVPITSWHGLGAHVLSWFSTISSCSLFQLLFIRAEDMVEARDLVGTRNSFASGALPLVHSSVHWSSAGHLAPAPPVRGTFVFCLSLLVERHWKGILHSELLSQRGLVTKKWKEIRGEASRAEIRSADRHIRRRLQKRYADAVFDLRTLEAIRGLVLEAGSEDPPGHLVRALPPWLGPKVGTSCAFSPLRFEIPLLSPMPVSLWDPAEIILEEEWLSVGEELEHRRWAREVLDEVWPDDGGLPLDLAELRFSTPSEASTSVPSSLASSPFSSVPPSPRGVDAN